ncbi:YeaC family protein [Entomomonas sp. E2T0]|uniref:YeaC family protein n=1 Tax=Entomomonas sp. E2T0 TaxID=2930213 RepID=UPI0022283A74|nr:YeaC family protein [Entomomonas sp. E2T0]UYZ84042.1 YeaC family protein [Entomomonas sp. E2T0]
MTSYVEMIEKITPEIYQNLKQSVELGKWPNGKPLTAEQRETCLQAIIAWELKHLPEEERTGFIDGPGCQSHKDDDHHDEKIIIKTKTTH